MRILVFLFAAVLGLTACSERIQRSDAPEPQPASAPEAKEPKPASPFRVPGTRDQTTIFTAIDHPDPSSLRLASGIPGPDYWQQRCDYTIEATLDAENREISASAVITYTNNSPHALDYIWLNLEQNLFHPESKGARLTPPGARFGNRDGFEGGFDISLGRLAFIGSSTLGAGSRNASSPPTLRVYDTLGRIDMPRALQPDGDRVQFEIRWSFKIPEYGSDRLAIEEVSDGTIFQLAQWFPNVCVYDDVHGWNTMDYLGTGEFYTNFGDYDVKLTVPRSHIVAATGALQNPEDVLTETQLERMLRARQSRETVMIRSQTEVNDPASRPAGEGPLTWHFKADDVRTFAWASSDAYIWDAAFLADSGPLNPDGSRQGTLVQSVYPREGERFWPQSTEMLLWSIEHYNTKWFTYPYPSATNVNGRVGGMEYPMIIFCRNRRNESGLFGVTTHEIGHNWFPMVVSTDERRHAWMDEGFNSFINYYARSERYDTIGGRGNAREFVDDMQEEEQQPLVTYPDQIRPGRLGDLEYSKPAVALVLLRDTVLGPERFDPAFQRYIAQWAFKHPQPADFFRCIEDAAGQNLDWFWRGWFYETVTLDQAIENVRIDDGQILATFRNNGGMVMPVDFEITYGDGSTERRRLPVEAWMTTDLRTARWPANGRTPTKLVIDPDEVYPDTDLGNNVWRK